MQGRTTRASTGLQVRLRVDRDEQAVFGPGKAELLRKIDATGSIRSAASKMGMSYNRAWTLVRDMNRNFGAPLVEAERGGGRGGGASLTTTGKRVLRLYSRMETSCRRAAAPAWRALRRTVR